MTPILDLPPFSDGPTDVDGPLDALGESTDSGRYVTFDLGGNRFCIAASAIAEITGPLACTFLPNAPAFVAGLAPFRGEALAVIGLRHLLETGDADPVSRPKTLVLRDGGSATRIAFEIDRMLDVVEGDIAFSPIRSPGVVDAAAVSSDGETCRRIDAARLYSLLNS